MIDIRRVADSDQNDTRISKLLVSFDSEIRRAPDIKIMRISESGH